MKISRMERKVLKQQIQSGFMQSWMAESRAKKEEKQSSDVRQAKRRALRWWAFWKRPVQS